MSKPKYYIKCFTRKECQEAHDIFVKMGYGENVYVRDKLPGDLNDVCVLSGIYDIISHSEEDAAHFLAHGYKEYKKENKAKEEKIMPKFKAGERVRVKDFSYSVAIPCMENKVTWGGIIYEELITTEYEVVDCGSYTYPTTKPLNKTTVVEPNDTILRCVKSIRNTKHLGRILFIHSSRCASLDKPVIKIGKDEVKFNPDGSLTVGCTKVDKKIVEQIIDRINKGDK